MPADPHMRHTRTGWRFIRQISRLTLPAIAVFFFLLPPETPAYSAAEMRSFQRSIIDYRWRQNPRFKKIKRKDTRYIIVHTSEGGLKSTLRTVTRGKRRRGRSYTYGGHANYVVARDGRTFRTLDKKYRADHAGRSMWNRQTDLSDISIGIEMVGYHYAPITDKQYQSVGKLIKILQAVYDLDDRDVLTHSQIAYGKPNRWIHRLHRGRKRCAKNFERHKAGLGPTWDHDPDVRAGRLAADPKLAKVFYSPKRVAVAASTGTNLISGTNTAWSIAGEDYNSPTTIYRLPDGKEIPGDKIEKRIGWSRIPPKTEVLLNQQEPEVTAVKSGPIKVITDSATAWSHAGKAYNRNSTIYIFPNGRVVRGAGISDWDDLPKMTRLIIGYRGPFKIDRETTAYRIAGQKHKNRTTVYFIPPRIVMAGDQIADFKSLPTGTMVFLPN
jgi:hypothetical protein